MSLASPPPNSWGRGESLSSAPPTGYGLVTPVISDYIGQRANNFKIIKMDLTLPSPNQEAT